MGEQSVPWRDVMAVDPAEFVYWRIVARQAGWPVSGGIDMPWSGGITWVVRRPRPWAAGRLLPPWRDERRCYRCRWPFAALVGRAPRPVLIGSVGLQLVLCAGCWRRSSVAFRLLAHGYYTAVERRMQQRWPEVAAAVLLAGEADGPPGAGGAVRG